MATEMEGEPLPRKRAVLAEPPARELLRAADLIRGAVRPVALAGNGVIRAKAAPALREFVRATGIPVAETFMGKGLLPADDDKALGSVGLQAGDYEMAGFGDADVVLAIGYDLVEHSPEHWNPKRDKTDHLHRLRARRDRRELHPRGRAGRATSTTCSPGSARSAATCPTRAARPSCATWCWAASSRRRTTTPSRSSRRARSGRSARRSAARTS